jgi:CheY-like chemotaxis protein
MSGDGDTRILVLDDVPENLRLLEAVLAARGYDVVSANRWSCCSQARRVRDPDLALLDGVMPVVPHGVRQGGGRGVPALLRAARDGDSSLATMPQPPCITGASRGQLLTAFYGTAVEAETA